jgi:peptidoglycan/xylan/chitin deacetylase (PgdA/CDA1 family)
MMNSAEVRKLHESGMEIGGHTINHPILTRLNREAALDEIAGGRDALERIIEKPIATFAYPNGKPEIDYAPEHVELVKEAGFEAAVSTRWGAATARTDRFQIPRVGVANGSQFATALRLLRYYFD